MQSRDELRMSFRTRLTTGLIFLCSIDGAIALTLHPMLGVGREQRKPGNSDRFDRLVFLVADVGSHR